ncbi:aminopeptidase [Mycobacterium sp. IDR2000157661]|uniref:aminopeptidase n=1 Tax=Mycobacterium sp. IDR2000157661 TaxID=2867005 RepID=UPI001EEF1199|nr:aminopeptidase [Mycobacterium sp. IDR2000157661]ULE34623.1 aminopeptidase [Mycobacterium sp. IDR2000157661]
MNLRRLVLLAGAVVLVVGIVGLLLPVSIAGSEGQEIGCGNAVAADYSAAREADNSNPVNLPVINEIVPHTDAVAQCESAVSDRRMWAIPVAIIGAVLLVGGLLVGGRGTRTR